MDRTGSDLQNCKKKRIFRSLPLPRTLSLSCQGPNSIPDSEGPQSRCRTAPTINRTHDPPLTSGPDTTTTHSLTQPEDHTSGNIHIKMGSSLNFAKVRSSIATPYPYPYPPQASTTHPIQSPILFTHPLTPPNNPDNPNPRLHRLNSLPPPLPPHNPLLPTLPPTILAIPAHAHHLRAHALAPRPRRRRNNALFPPVILATKSACC